MACENYTKSLCGSGAITRLHAAESLSRQPLPDATRTLRIISRSLILFGSPLAPRYIGYGSSAY